MNGADCMSEKDIEKMKQLLEAKKKQAKANDNLPQATKKVGSTQTAFVNKKSGGSINKV